MAEKLYQHLAHLTPEQLKENLKDPNWRIRNLYYILDKNGHTVLFEPNDVQEQFIIDLWHKNIVPKARQRGFSTVAQLMILDSCLFVVNTVGAIVAQDRETAGKIMRQKIKFAYERLPKFLRDLVPTKVYRKTEIVFANGSSIQVSTSARGDTLNWLHVSEFGAICAHTPDKAEEITTGALPAAANGITIIESTAKGRDGQYYKMVQTAKAHAEAKKPLSRLDYRLHFASWWDADEYEVDPAHVVISPLDHAYFDRKEGEIGRPIRLAKRAWYVATRDGDFAGDEEKMWAEYPTTVDEAFQVSTEGVWLKDQLALARRQRRICKLPYDPSKPVNTFWDIGVDDDCAIWFHQEDGAFDNFINFIEGSGEAYSYFWRKMQALGYAWGRHYLPHDAAHRRPGSEVLKTSKDMLEDLGLRNIEIVPQIHDLTAGINMMRDRFSRYRIDEENCKEGIIHIEGYRKRRNMNTGEFTSEPLKNGHQHAADALRQHAQYADHISNDTGQKRLKRRGSAMTT